MDLKKTVRRNKDKGRKRVSGCKRPGSPGTTKGKVSW